MAWPNEFNEDLSQFLAQKKSASPALTDAIAYATRSPGKRLRPLFAQESGALFGLNPTATSLFSIAIELVHLFSLIHDDLPALDNDDFRRGLPTLHKEFNEGIALLAGDELLNFAHETFLMISEHVSPSAFLEAFRYFTDAIGSNGMIGGQTLEMELTQNNDPLLLETLLKIQSLKTGALFRASIVIPALLSGIQKEDSKIRELTEFAEAFGFAFQIADDLEDEAQDEKTSRKNILSHLGRESAIQLALNRLSSASVSRNFSATQRLTELLQSKP